MSRRLKLCSVHYLKELEDTLKMRKEDDFLSPTVAAEKRKLIDDGYDSDEMTSTCNDFFGNFVSFEKLFNGLIPILTNFAVDALEVVLWFRKRH